VSGRGTSVSGLRCAGLIVSALLVSMTGRSVEAEETFAFADEASIIDAMATLNDNLAYNVEPSDPCRLHILNDLRGHTVFDEATFQSVHQALATGIFGADKVDDCIVDTHAISQNDVINFLEEQRASGNGGLALALTYYQLSDSVTVFASLRDERGALLGSSGRFDLPVVAVASTKGAGQTDVVGAPSTETEAQPSNQTTIADETTLEPTPTPIQDVAATNQQQADPLTASGEEALRRQLVADAQIEKTLSGPFNLRRIKAGIPPSIKTVRVIDADGQDTALMEDLASSFLNMHARSSGSSVERIALDDNGRQGTKVIVDGEPKTDIEAIDIELANGRSAFELILDNRADIVVTRKAISPEDAERFAKAFGVNMRSRYAEHVVAIAEGEVNSLDCGIRYPQNEMLMSTEEDPTSARVYIYNNPSVPGPMRDQFIDHALSSEGQAVVANHAVDLRLQLSDAGYAAWRYEASGEREAELPEVLNRFRGLIRTSQRVSSTFRFDFASSDLVLDARSEQDLDNLIDLVKTRDIDSRRILLFGFADSLGAAPYNADLSRSRADAVAIRLRLAGIPVPPRNVYGIGEDSPVACDLQQDGEPDEAGASKNRRVEVWIES